ncbi:hypothetical protein HW555_003087, partial [Spodoptera exigua]
TTMEEILKVLQNIQNELAQQKQDIKSMEENIKEAINKNIDEKFNRFEAKTNQLEQKIEEQQKTIDYLDKKLRRKNIIFFGVPETENSYEDLIKSILDILNKTMKIECPKWEIETVARLGKNTGKVRPVVVTITTTSRKLEILKLKKSLENTGIYIKEDYSAAVLQKRKELQEELQRKRLSGEKVMLRYDKIVQIKPREKQTYKPKGAISNKRYLSESPEAVHFDKMSNNEEQSKQIPKKNKSQTITTKSNSDQSLFKPRLSRASKKLSNAPPSSPLPTRPVPVGDADQNPLEKTYYTDNNSEYNKLYIATYNVRTLLSYSRLLELSDALKDINYDVIGLSETRRFGNSIEEHEDFILYYMGQTPGLYGVGFILQPAKKSRISYGENTNSTLKNYKEIHAYKESLNGNLKHLIASQQSYTVQQIHDEI